MKKFINGVITILKSVEFWKIMMPVAIAIFAWHYEASSKLNWERYQQKQTNYSELIEALEGFYVNGENKYDQKQKFIKQLNLSWLYASDVVINNAYNFLETVKTGVNYSERQKEEALGKFVLSIREDLLSRKRTKNTNLKYSDFQSLTATKSNDQ